MKSLKKQMAWLIILIISAVGFINCGKYQADFSAISPTQNAPVIPSQDDDATAEMPDGEISFSNDPELSAASAGPGTLAYRTLGTTASNMGFVEYLPADYQNGTLKNGTLKKWPLIFFLHGGGEMGNGVGDLPNVNAHGPTRRVLQGRHFPAVILAPQISGLPTSQGPNLCSFLDFAEANYRIDAKRIYVTGLSSGAMSLLKMSQICAGKLAAFAPFSGSYFSWLPPPALTTAEALNFYRVPTWFAHAQDDANPSTTVGDADKGLDAVGTLLGLTNSIRSGNAVPIKTMTARLAHPLKWEWVAGLNARQLRSQADRLNVRYTVFAQGGHGIWTQMYESEEFWTWMFQQRRP